MIRRVFFLLWLGCLLIVAPVMADAPTSEPVARVCYNSECFSPTDLVTLQIKTILDTPAGRRAVNGLEIQFFLNNTLQSPMGSCITVGEGSCAVGFPKKNTVLFAVDSEFAPAVIANQVNPTGFSNFYQLWQNYLITQRPQQVFPLADENLPYQMVTKKATNLLLVLYPTSAIKNEDTYPYDWAMYQKTTSGYEILEPAKINPQLQSFLPANFTEQTNLPVLDYEWLTKKDNQQQALNTGLWILLFVFIFFIMFIRGKKKHEKIT